MNIGRETLKRLEKVEKKLGTTPQEIETKKRLDELNTVLWMTEYYRRFEEMTMTPEEIWKANQESSDRVVEWYCKFQKLSPEEQEMDRKQMAESTERDKAWLNSEERRQFDKDYEEYMKRKNQNQKTEETNKP